MPKSHPNFTGDCMNESPVILFDGVCNLCNRSVQTVIRHDRHGVFKFASLQSNSGQQILQQYNIHDAELNSFVLVENGNLYLRSTAALRVAGQLQGPIRWLKIFLIVPAFIRDGVYALIARNRYKWFGKSESCMMPTPSIRARFLP
jgi:predicted DCC family thiol-disulfide oxidoreductase YuxK